MKSGPRLLLCPFERRHLKTTLRWANDPELCRLLDRTRTVSELEHEQWFASLATRTDMVLLALETIPDKTHIGNIWLAEIDPRHRKAEVRVLIGEPEYQGSGYGTEAFGLLSDHARDSLQLHKLCAYILNINPRALRAFEKAGFAIEGLLRQDRYSAEGFLDVYLLGKILSAS